MPDPQQLGEDRFIATILQIANWAQKNTRALILAVGALAILIFAVNYYVDYRQRVRDAATAELRTIRSQLQAGNPGQVVDQLKNFLVQFGDAPNAREARVLLAESLLLVNRAGEAIEPARQAMGGLGNDILSLRAAFLLGAAYEETGDTSAAIGVYERVAESVDYRVQRTRGLEAAARLHAARGNTARALAIYDQLTELTPADAPARSFYEMRAAELRAESGGSFQGS
ncbi:MAG: tetratricopeptide repeat protein [Gemmatimonadales bacterium]|jgi:predicted negative regulator of RcsB-dependent stress response